MKKSKKLISFLTACVMSVSVGAFAACDGTGGGYGDPKSAEEADKVIEKLEEVKPAGVSVDGSITTDGIKVDISAKANLSAGAFDVTLHNTDEKEATPYAYCFMRDWKVYGAVSQAEIKDFSSAILKPIVDIGAVLEEQTGANSLLLNLYAPKIMNAVVSAGNYMILSLGKVTNSVAFKGNTITVDYNLATYQIFNDVKDVIDGMTATTTVGDILGNDNVRKYAEIFTELVSYNDLATYVSLIKSIIGGQGSQLILAEEIDYTQVLTAALDAIDSLLKAVTPDANSNTYDYLVKLLSSDELREMINNAAGGEFLEKNLSEYSVKDIVSLAAEQPVTDEQVNVMLTATKEELAENAKNISKESITVVDGTGTSVASGIKYTLMYNDEYVLLSQGIEGNIAVTDSADASANSQTAIKLTVSYSGKTFTLSTLPAKLPEFSGNGDSGDYDEDSVYGKYYFESMIEGDTTIDNSVLGRDYMVINLKADGTSVMTVGGIAMSGTYSIDGTALYLTANGQTDTCRLENGKIIMETDGTVITLSK